MAPAAAPAAPARPTAAKPVPRPAAAKPQVVSKPAAGKPELVSKPKAAAKPAGKSACACKGQTKAEKTREVDKEVRKEKVATKARQARTAKDLKDDTARVQKAIRKTEEPARRAHQQKLAAHARPPTLRARSLDPYFKHAPN